VSKDIKNVEAHLYFEYLCFYGLLWFFTRVLVDLVFLLQNQRQSSLVDSFWA